MKFCGILLALSQLVKFCKSKLKALFNFLNESLIFKRSLSSAKWWTRQCLIAVFKSLICKEITVVQEQSLLEHQSNWQMFRVTYIHWLKHIVFYLSNKTQTNYRLHLYLIACFSLPNRILWSTVSKAFSRSTKISQPYLPWSSVSFLIDSVTWINAYEVG